MQLKMFIIILILLLNPFLSNAQSLKSPRVLSYSESKRYIDCVKSFPWLLQRAFGWEGGLARMPTYIFSDSTNIQVYSFPNGYTTLGFAMLSEAGLVVFKTGTDSIISIFPWSDKIKDQIVGDYPINLNLDRTYYKFREQNSGWGLSAIIIAIADDDYYTIQFNLDADMMGSGYVHIPVITNGLKRHN